MCTVLPSIELFNLIKEGLMEIEPFEHKDEFTPPSSIDLRLAGKVLLYEGLKEYTLGEHIDDKHLKIKEVHEGHFILKPGESAIFQLYEKLRLPHFIMGLIFARSSITRIGLSITPTYLNPGYDGYSPIMLTNNSRILIKIPFYQGRSPRIAQAIFFKLAKTPHRPYGTGPDEKYQGDLGYHTRIYKDYDIYDLLKPLTEIAKKTQHLAY